MLSFCIPVLSGKARRHEWGKHSDARILAGDYVDVHEPAMEEPTKEDTAETVTTGTPIPEDASTDEFASEIAMLRGMGFDGAEEGLIDMLRKKQGDVNAVVNELLMV